MVRIRHVSPVLVLWCLLYGVLLVFIGWVNPQEQGIVWLLAMTVALPLYTDVFADFNHRTLDFATCATQSYLRQFLTKVFEVVAAVTLVQAAAFPVVLLLRRGAAFPEPDFFYLLDAALRTHALLLLFIAFAVFCRPLGKTAWALPYFAVSWGAVMLIVITMVELRWSDFTSTFSIFSPLSPENETAAIAHAVRLDVLRYAVSAPILLAALFGASIFLLSMMKRSGGLNLTLFGKRDAGLRVLLGVLILAPILAAGIPHDPLYVSPGYRLPKTEWMRTRKVWAAANTPGIYPASIEVRLSPSRNDYAVKESFRIENPRDEDAKVVLMLPRYASNLTSNIPLASLPGENIGRHGAVLSLRGSAAVDFTSEHRVPARAFSLTRTYGRITTFSQLRFDPTTPFTLNPESLLLPWSGPRAKQTFSSTPSPYFNVFDLEAGRQNIAIEAPEEFQDDLFTDGRAILEKTGNPPILHYESARLRTITGYPPATVLSAGGMLRLVLPFRPGDVLRNRLRDALVEVETSLKGLKLSGEYVIDGHCLIDASTYGWSSPDPSFTSEFGATFRIARCLLSPYYPGRAEFFSLLLLDQMYVISGKMGLSDFRDSVRQLLCKGCWMSEPMKLLFDYLGLQSGKESDPAVARQVLEGLMTALRAAHDASPTATIQESKDPNPFDALGVARPRDSAFFGFPTPGSKK